MPRNLSEEEMQEILEDRKNGMGLQKVSKKYNIGVPRIRKIEKEQGLEVAIPSSRPLRVEDVEKHFQESRESFAIVVEELQRQQKQIQVLLDKIEEEYSPADAQLLEEMQEDTELLEEMQEDVEELEEKIGWQIGTSTLLGAAGLLFAAGTLYLQWNQLRQFLSAPERPKVYYTPPTVEEECPKDLPKKKSKLQEME